MIKIGIDPSGTGTTAIVVFEDIILLDKQEFINKDWKEHSKFIRKSLFMIIPINYEKEIFINIENCLPTNANGSKDRDDLLRLLGSIYDFWDDKKRNWVSPRHTKSVVKNMENLSKYNNGCIQDFSKDNNLTYQYGKGWKYNNEKISNHLRDAIIIANYES